MSTRLVGRDIMQCFQGSRSEGPARGSEQQAPYPFGRQLRCACAICAFGQTLKDRVVLAIDGKQLGPTIANRLHEQTTCSDQCFLVRKQNPLARPGSSECGRQPSCTHYGGHDGGDLGVSRRCNKGFCPHSYFRHGPAYWPLSPKFLRRLIVRHHDDRCATGYCLLDQLADSAVRTQGVNLETIGMARDHIKCALTDGTRGTQHADILYLH